LSIATLSVVAGLEEVIAGLDEEVVAGPEEGRGSTRLIEVFEGRPAPSALAQPTTSVLIPTK
jgi:hypothetical protein